MASYCLIRRDRAGNFWFREELPIEKASAAIDRAAEQAQEQYGLPKGEVFALSWRDHKGDGRFGDQVSGVRLYTIKRRGVCPLLSHEAPSVRQPYDDKP